MNKNFEEAYKEQILSDLPDLWDRIEAALPEDNTINETNKTKPAQKKKKKASIKWLYTAIPVLAAVFLIVPLGAFFIGAGLLSLSRSNSKADTTANFTYSMPVSEAAQTFVANDDYEEESYSVDAIEGTEEVVEDYIEPMVPTEAIGNSADISIETELGDSETLKNQTLDEYINDNNSERFNHSYDFTTDFDDVTAQLVATNITVKVTGFYTNEQGLNAELMVVKVADEYTETDTGRLFAFVQDECLCAHVYKDYSGLNVGDVYSGNIFLATDGSLAEWWEFVVIE